MSAEYHKLDNERQVFFYEQDFYVLSNFSAFRLHWRGWDFDTSEEYLVEFLKVRLPFYTLVRYEPLRGFWDFYRPLPEELERLMMSEPRK